MNTPRLNASGFTFSSCLLRAQVSSGLPDLPDQGPGRRHGEGPRQRGRRPTEPGRLVLVRGETSPPGVVRRGRVLEVDVRHKPGGDDEVTTGREPSQRSGHSIVQKKLTIGIHEVHGTFTKHTGDTVVVGGFFFLHEQSKCTPVKRLPGVTVGWSCDRQGRLHHQLRRVLPSRCCSRPTCLPRPAACFCSRKADVTTGPSSCIFICSRPRSLHPPTDPFRHPSPSPPLKNVFYFAYHV